MIGQVFLTVLSGVLVYVVGQVFVKFVIDPIQAFYKVIGEVGHTLIYYANVYCNTRSCNETLRQEASAALRRLSSQLYSTAYAIPWYGVWAKLRFLHPYKDIREASGYLHRTFDWIHRPKRSGN